jgi:uncharacterized protein GlcG (DUF336 family)
MHLPVLALGFATVLAVAGTTGRADDRGPSSGCRDLPSHAALRDALQAAQSQSNGGFGLEMWATVVNRDGIVCQVVFSGGNRGDQWPGSRVISAQKANTANAFSLPGLALSTANDPMVGGRIGGVNVFGGGLGLYAGSGRLVGGVGVSGDSSCADHNIAWRVRNTLGLDYVPAGVSGDPARPDNIVYDITPQAGQMPGVSAGGWGHAACSAAATAIAATLPAVKP